MDGVVVHAGSLEWMNPYPYKKKLSVGTKLYTHPQPLAQDAEVMFAPPETEEDVIAYLQIARLHVKRFREVLRDAMAKESGHD